MTTDDLGASVRLDHQLLAVEHEHRVHCMLELTAPKAPVAERRPLHLALVIDRSGSMGGEKLETAKTCAAYLARRLAPTDQLAVVTYDDEVRLDLLLTPVGHDQLALEHALNAIRPGGSTNLSGGWLKGVEQLRAVPGGTGPKKVLLLTDGHANQGVTDPEPRLRWHGALAATASARRRSGSARGSTRSSSPGSPMPRPGTRTSPPRRRRRSASSRRSSRGSSRWSRRTSRSRSAPAPTSRCSASSTSTRSCPSPADSRRSSATPTPRSGAGVVFELAVPALATLGVVPVAEVVVRYVSLGERIEAHELRLPITVNAVSADEAQGAGPDEGVIEEIVVLKSARAQRFARERADHGDFETARKLLEEAAEHLRKVAPGSPRAEELLTQAEETVGFAQSMSEATYDESTKKNVRYSSWQRQRGRPRA